jgi:hypothetical protein
MLKFEAMMPQLVKLAIGQHSKSLVSLRSDFERTSSEVVFDRQKSAADRQRLLDTNSK